MNKLKAALVAVLCALAGTLAWVIQFFRQREEQRAQDSVAANLKAKVAEIKAQRAADKAQAEALVAAVQSEADATKAADPVDIANTLILNAKADKS